MTMSASTQQGRADIVGRAQYGIKNRAEAAFAQELDAAGRLWFYQPKTFSLPAPIFGSYRPDFYVVDDACFYEVVGTRQAFSLARERIELFRSTYPQHRLEIVNQGGWLIKRGMPRKSRVKQAERAANTKAWANAERELPEGVQDIVGAARLRGIRSYSELGIFCGVSGSNVNAILRLNPPKSRRLPMIRAALGLIAKSDSVPVLSIPTQEAT